MGTTILKLAILGFVFSLVTLWTETSQPIKQNQLAMGQMTNSDQAIVDYQIYKRYSYTAPVVVTGFLALFLFREEIRKGLTKVKSSN